MSIPSTALPRGRQRFARLNDKSNPVSRAKAYQLAAVHPELLKKLDGITFLDLDVFDEIVAASPPAQVKRKHEVA
jgi:hypothetical protein